MLPLAISPCPNDTFLFHAWIHGLVGSEFPIKTYYADIDQLNTWALENRFPLLKISCACVGKVLEDYQFLPVGAALGYGCGPKIIAKEAFPLEELSKKSIAIPGMDTTSHLLLEFFAPAPKYKLFCRYHEIASLLHQDVVDCGLIIHESRFTYEKEGFIEIADMGELWEKRFHLPLPLGGLVLRRDIPLKNISSMIQASLLKGWECPHLSHDFVLEKAQEKEWETIQKHIDLYVSKETLELSNTGKQAINTLLNCGAECGWYPTQLIEGL